MPKSSPAEGLRKAVLALALAAAAWSPPPAALAQATVPADKQAIPFRREADPVDFAMLLRVALALGLVIAVGVGGIYALKRFLPGSLGRAGTGPGRINVLEIRRLTPRLTLFLVEVDGHKLFLAQSGDRVRPLRLDAGTEAGR